MKKILVAMATTALFTAPAQADFRVVVDPMTDAQRGIASLVSQDGNGAIAFKCDANGKDSFYIQIISEKYLGKGMDRGLRTFKWRVDGSEIQTLDGYYDGTQVIVKWLKPTKGSGALVKSIATGEKLVLELSTYDYDRVIMTFDITGFGADMKKSVDTCQDPKWMPEIAALVSAETE